MYLLKQRALQLLVDVQSVARSLAQNLRQIVLAIKTLKASFIGLQLGIYITLELVLSLNELKLCLDDAPV